jgi:hypothetical protein
MREVQPEINFLVNPIKEKLFMIIPDSARWERRIDKDDGDSGRHRRKYRSVKPIQPGSAGSMSVQPISSSLKSPCRRPFQYA